MRAHSSWIVLVCVAVTFLASSSVRALEPPPRHAPVTEPRIGDDDSPDVTAPGDDDEPIVVAPDSGSLAAASPAAKPARKKNKVVEFFQMVRLAYQLLTGGPLTLPLP